MSLGVVLIVALMPVHAFLSTWLGTSIGPLLVWKSWKELLLVALLPAVLWYMVLRPDIGRTLWSRWVNRLILAYSVLQIGLSFVSTASAQAVIAGLMMNLRFLAIFVLVQVIVEARPTYLARLGQWAPRWLLLVMLGLGVLALLQVYALPVDFLTHFGYNKDATIAPYVLVDQNPHALRAFATLRGPNTLGSYLLLPLAAAASLLYARRRDWLAWASLSFGVVALVLSGSRSAWLGFGVMLVTLMLVLLPRAHIARSVKVWAVPVLVLAAAIGWAATTLPAVRLAVFHSSPGDNSLNEGSDAKHWEAAAQGIADVVRHPWGSGPGSAGPASFYNTGPPNLSENYYVQVAQEAGLIGLGLFAAILLCTALRIVRRMADPLAIALLASFAGMAVVNIFLHGWADDPTALTWWALAGLYIGRAR